jgi:hypothetical protein
VQLLTGCHLSQPGRNLSRGLAPARVGVGARNGAAALRGGAATAGGVAATGVAVPAGRHPSDVA